MDLSAQGRKPWCLFGWTAINVRCGPHVQRILCKRSDKKQNAVRNGKSSALRHLLGKMVQTDDHP